MLLRLVPEILILYAFCDVVGVGEGDSRSWIRNCNFQALSGGESAVAAQLPQGSSGSGGSSTARLALHLLQNVGTICTELSMFCYLFYLQVERVDGGG